MDLRLAPTEAERRPWTGLGIRQILLLIISKAFLIDHCYFALMLHFSAPLLQGRSKPPQFFQLRFRHTRIITIRGKDSHTFQL